MIKRSSCVLFAFLAMTGPACAGGDLFEELFAPYSQRIEGVSPSAGNAKAINSATQIINPWPPYVANRRIPANGERMAGAIERYRDVKKLSETPPTLEPDTISTSDVTGGSGSGSGGGTSQ